MDNFESLNNNDLRDQLKLHGINVPVTDTTRNLLIKKLRTSINGPAKPTKARRETINVNVAKPPPEDSESDADVKKAAKAKTAANRRTTIAATAPKQPQPVVQLSQLNGVQAEKVKIVERKTPPRSPSRKSALPSQAVRVPELIDDSDDDLVAAVEAAERQKYRSKKSRSPSLGKSTTVTTSYKHTIAPLVEQKNDDVVFINDSSDAEFSSEMLDAIRKAKPGPLSSKISAANEHRRTTIAPAVSISTNKPFEDRSSAPSNYSKIASDAVNTYRRRYTTHTPTKNYAAGSGEKESDEDVLKRVDTPFLSDFTRRLAELKAEPLPGVDKYSSPTTSYRQRDYRQTMYASVPSQSGERARDKLMALNKTESRWSQFEKKIRWPLFILLALFVIVFVYVFFFSNY